MQEIIRICIAIEERVGEIYSALALYPNADAELRALWTELAAEEAGHARKIQQVTEHLTPETLMTAGVDHETVQALLERADEVLQSVRNGELSVTEALFTSVELEDQFMKVHLLCAEAGQQGNLQQMYSDLAAEDRSHTERLKANLQRYSDGMIFEDTES